MSSTSGIDYNLFIHEVNSDILLKCIDTLQYTASLYLCDPLD